MYMSATVSDAEAPPARGKMHDALAMFLGDWKAEGESYGSPDQDPRNPKGKSDKWTSTHSARWHTGEFFLIQNERAIVGGNPFDTISIMGVDAKTGKYFAHGSRIMASSGATTSRPMAACGHSLAPLSALASSSARMDALRRSRGNGSRTANGCRSAIVWPRGWCADRRAPEQVRAYRWRDLG
jgi:hypothetical protein